MPAWSVILLIIIGGLFALKLTYVIATGWALPTTRGALFVPSHPSRIKTLLDAVPMGPEDVFLDLGCGDARVLAAARRRYGVRVLGFEMNLFAYFMARVRSAGTRGMVIRKRSFWADDLGGATGVFCYLFPDVMGSLSRKLQRELRPGARVISSHFPIPGWHPQKVIRTDSVSHGDPMYVYHIPASCPPGDGETHSCRDPMKMQSERRSA